MSNIVKVEAYELEGKLYKTREEADSVEERNFCQDLIDIVDNDDFNAAEKAITFLVKLRNNKQTTKAKIEALLGELEDMEIREYCE